MLRGGSHDATALREVGSKAYQLRIAEEILEWVFQAKRRKDDNFFQVIKDLLHSGGLRKGIYS